MTLDDMTPYELELRIMVANVSLNWLRSDDPMLQEQENKKLAEAAIQRVSEELRQLQEALDKKKQPEPVTVGLNRASLTAKRL